jgi:hypothetical protein
MFPLEYGIIIAGNCSWRCGTVAQVTSHDEDIVTFSQEHHGCGAKYVGSRLP